MGHKIPGKEKEQIKSKKNKVEYNCNINQNSFPVGIDHLNMNKTITKDCSAGISLLFARLWSENSMDNITFIFVSTIPITL